MHNPVMELLNTIKDAPNPAKYANDSELAQAYRNWFYGKRTDTPSEAQVKVFIRRKSGELLDATPIK